MLAGGGIGGALLLDELLELLLDELLGGGMHGWIATDSVIELFGTTIEFEPGGGVVAPDVATCASEQAGTTIVSGACCLGISTTRTPGSIRAVETGFIIELDELLLLLPPQDANPDAIATATTARVTVDLTTIIRFPSLSVWPAPVAVRFDPPRRGTVTTKRFRRARP